MVEGRRRGVAGRVPEGLDVPGRSAYFCDMTRFLIPVFALAVSPLQAGIKVEKDGNNLKVLVDGKLFTDRVVDASTFCTWKMFDRHHKVAFVERIEKVVERYGM